MPLEEGTKVEIERQSKEKYALYESSAEKF